MTGLNKGCFHDWKNDPNFEDGIVEMFTSMQGEEMRQYCTKCSDVRYIPKNTFHSNGSGEKS